MWRPSRATSAWTTPEALLMSLSLCGAGRKEAGGRFFKRGKYPEALETLDRGFQAT